VIQEEKMKKAIVVLLCLAIAGAAFAGPSQQGGGSGTYIPIISKGFMHQWMQAVKQGVEKAGQDFNVQVTFDGPENETQIDKQMELFQTALGKNPAAVGFAALDSKAAIPLLQQCQKKKIPVIAWDSGVDSDIPVTLVATDNSAAAGVAADKLAEAIGGKGKVAVLTMDQTTMNSIQRRDGFLNAIKKYPNIQVVSVEYGNGDHLKSSEIAKTVMNANPDLVGYFGANEGSAVGLINAVKELKKEGKVVLVGYDSGKLQLDAIRSGLMYGAVQQNPVLIGYKTVESAIKASKGEILPKFIDSGYVWSDKSNLDSAEVKAVIYE
jgi:ribose transport system substrate-binding protein